VNLGPGEFPRA